MPDKPEKKDYDGPLYAPWSAVVAGWSKEKLQQWLKKQSKNK